MKFLKTFSIIAAFLFTNCVTTSSQKFNNWTLLGEKVVDYRPDRDVMIINSSPTYNRIKVKVHEGKVLIQDMKVEFGNGEVRDIPLKYVFNEGGYSRDIDLEGNRHITRITFRYRTAKNSFEKGDRKSVV